MRTILVVDDEQDLLSLLTEILGGAGYRVIQKTDAESALSLIRERTKIDLVITDNMLPGMPGQEFSAFLNKALPSVPVIMLTGYGSVESYLQCLDNGVFEYVNKPVRAGEFRRIVKAALDSSQTVNSTTLS